MAKKSRTSAVETASKKGLRYVDDTPKQSYPAVKQAAEAARAGDVECGDD